MRKSRVRTKANENALQRDIVTYLNGQSGLKCKVSRIKNMGTFDPVRGFFRSNNMERGIPDIIGCKHPGKAIFIEVKLSNPAGKYSISKEQKNYLQEQEKLGAIVGIAFSLGDAFDIIADDQIKYPRNDRTYLYRDKTDRPKKKAKSRDPLAFLASFHEEGDNDGATGEGDTETTEREP